MLLQGHGIGEALPGFSEELQQEEERSWSISRYAFALYIYSVHSSLSIFLFFIFIHQLWAPLQQLPVPLVGPTCLLVSLLSLFFIFHPSVVGHTTAASCPYPSVGPTCSLVSLSFLIFHPSVVGPLPTSISCCPKCIYWFVHTWGHFWMCWIHSFEFHDAWPHWWIVCFFIYFSVLFFHPSIGENWLVGPT